MSAAIDGDAAGKVEPAAERVDRRVAPAARIAFTALLEEITDEHVPAGIDRNAVGMLNPLPSGALPVRFPQRTRFEAKSRSKL